VLTAVDCDDADASLLAISGDVDCDGVLTADDCDDADPTTVNDMDCDGVLTADDCDDADASVWGGNLPCTWILAAFDSPLAWSAAEADCNTRGGNLAWIESSSVNLSVYSVCSQSSFGSKEGCWIGLQSPFTAWSNGDSLAYNNWYPGEFDSTNGYVAWMYAGYNKDMYWDDTSNSPGRPYVCRLPGATGDTTGAVATTGSP
jgi:hypothetical protein